MNHKLTFQMFLGGSKTTSDGETTYMCRHICTVYCSFLNVGLNCNLFFKRMCLYGAAACLSV